MACPRRVATRRKGSQRRRTAVGVRAQAQHSTCVAPTPTAPTRRHARTPVRPHARTTSAPPPSAAVLGPSRTAPAGTRTTEPREKQATTQATTQAATQAAPGGCRRMQADAGRRLAPHPSPGSRSSQPGLGCGAWQRCPRHSRRGSVPPGWPLDRAAAHAAPSRSLSGPTSAPSAALGRTARRRRRATSTGAGSVFGDSWPRPRGRPENPSGVSPCAVSVKEKVRYSAMPFLPSFSCSATPWPSWDRRCRKAGSRA